jgi:hypothetical protein
MFVGSGNSAMLQAGYAYDNGSYFNDVTSGANAVELGYGTCRVPYLCNGEPGYDAPSGVGTPNMGGSGNGSATVSGQSEGGTDGSNEGGKRKCGSKDGGSDAGDASDGGEDGSDDGSGGGGEGGVTCDNAEHSAPSP